MNDPVDGIIRESTCFKKQRTLSLRMENFYFILQLVIMYEKYPVDQCDYDWKKNSFV